MIPVQEHWLRDIVSSEIHEALAAVNLEATEHQESYVIARATHAAILASMRLIFKQPNFPDDDPPVPLRWRVKLWLISVFQPTRYARALTLSAQRELLEALEKGR